MKIAYLLRTGLAAISLMALATACTTTQEAKLGSAAPNPGIQSEEVRYSDGETEMIGYLSYPKDAQNAPIILVVHEWWGQNEYPRQRARMLAELGYVALAVDMYGDRQIADHPKTAGQFAQATMSNLDLAESRFQAAVDFAKNLPQSDSDRVAAIGYCFGGGIVLHMARRGLDLNGVASFHGSLGTPTAARKDQVTAKVLVANGAADPMVSQEQIAAFKAEMDAANVDYEFINYEGATHGFTNPEADRTGKAFNLPLAYDPNADRESWQKLQEFFSEIF